MWRLFFAFCLIIIVDTCLGQHPWKIKGNSIDPNNYHGITVANGMIGIVSSPEPFKVKEVIVLAGAYDLYGCGRVSNFLKSFNLLNMYLQIDGRRIGNKEHPI
jgi:protein-glucosylgalactosylhydroxylysine glucosidase